MVESSVPTNVKTKSLRSGVLGDMSPALQQGWQMWSSVFDKEEQKLCASANGRTLKHVADINPRFCYLVILCWNVSQPKIKNVQKMKS